MKRLLLSLLAPAVVAAQSVRGTVIDRGTEAAIPGVVVSLVDSLGITVTRALTNERGDYRVVAPSGGVYQLRTMRIGFRPVMSDAITLKPADDVEHRIVVAAIPVTLDTMKVVGRNACRALNDSASATYAIWNQVRTALTAAQITARVRSVDAMLVWFERTLDPSSRRVRQEKSTVKAGLVTQPWRSRPANELRRSGYVITEVDNSTTYYAPDLDVLLSDIFLEDHCFRLATSKDTSRLGIAFEPTRERKRMPEIEGTLWLDRHSARLRSLEFRYVNVSREQEDWARGDVEFVPMRNGGWVISRWSIQMPALQQRPAIDGYSVPGIRVVEVKVSGGDLSIVMRNADTLWVRP